MDSKIILLVEDNPDDEELTLLAFKQAKIANRIIVVRDGAEALDYLHRTGLHATRDPAGDPALVLLDLKLPKVDGLEVLRRMREETTTRNTPVVVLTSSREDEDVLSSYRSGCNSYVRKPVDFSRFIGTARQLGVYWLQLNEPPRAR